MMPPRVRKLVLRAVCRRTRSLRRALREFERGIYVAM